MKSNNIKSQFLNRKQAASYLNVTKSALEAWAVRGGGPVFLKFGRAVRYRLSDLAWFMTYKDAL